MACEEELTGFEWNGLHGTWEGTSERQEDDPTSQTRLDAIGHRGRCGGQLVTGSVDKTVRGAVLRTGPSPGIEGAGCPTLTYRTQPRSTTVRMTSAQAAYAASLIDPDRVPAAESLVV